MKIVPSTKLRAFYEFLASLSLSTETQKCIMNDLIRKDNHIKLVKLFNESFNHIESIYDNTNEPFLNPNAKRKPIIYKTTFESTNEVMSHFQNNKELFVSPPMYNFEYIEREISPLRTTNAKFYNGKSAKSSGTGGLDFIGWNTSKKLPVLGEIKVKNDQNPFYAIIQLLTYLSEISTQNQIDRINKFKLFGTDNSISSDTKFYLYIISCHKSNSIPKHNQLLPNAKDLAKKIVMEINKIEDILFFNLDPDTKVITQE